MHDFVTTLPLTEKNPAVCLLRAESPFVVSPRPEDRIIGGPRVRRCARFLFPAPVVGISSRSFEDLRDMAYVITQRCCNDASCVPECPVDCIRPTPEQPEFATTE
ncbi:hypothetical protein, partial [Nocardia nova]|uniref:hypothetical protein n=1 Tax=Nocardia nova TaxID=37330 RepID=UPI0033DDA207